MHFSMSFFWASKSVPKVGTQVPVRAAVGARTSFSGGGQIRIPGIRGSWVVAFLARASWFFIGCFLLVVADSLCISFFYSRVFYLWGWVWGGRFIGSFRGIGRLGCDYCVLFFLVWVFSSVFFGLFYLFLGDYLCFIFCIPGGTWGIFVLFLSLISFHRFVFFVFQFLWALGGDRGGARFFIFVFCFSFFVSARPLLWYSLLLFCGG